MAKKLCIHCNKELIGRPDKIFCDAYCRSANQYARRKNDEKFYFKVDRQLKTNRKILIKYNRQGKTVIRKSTLAEEGFNPAFFTHYWKNNKGKIYLFCYEYGFLSILDKNVEKYLLIQWQNYMK